MFLLQQNVNKSVDIFKKLIYNRIKQMLGKEKKPNLPTFNFINILL